MHATRFPLRAILCVCAALVFWTQGPGWPEREIVFETFGLSREALAAGRWWTFLTHALLHGSWWHAALNLASLWVLGRHLLDHYGNGFFLALLVAGVVAGGLAQVAASAGGILIGISGAVMAMVTAAGFLWDDKPVVIRLGPLRFGQLRGRHLGWGMLAGSLLFAGIARWMPEGGIAIGHACHAGAAVAGATIVLAARLAAGKERKERREGVEEART